MVQVYNEPVSIVLTPAAVLRVLAELDGYDGADNDAGRAMASAAALLRAWYAQQIAVSPHVGMSAHIYIAHRNRCLPGIVTLPRRHMQADLIFCDPQGSPDGGPEWTFAPGVQHGTKPSRAVAVPYLWHAPTECEVRQ
jgi:hypothetical protein